MRPGPSGTFQILPRTRPTRLTLLPHGYSCQTATVPPRELLGTRVPRAAATCARVVKVSGLMGRNAVFVRWRIRRFGGISCDSGGLRCGAGCRGAAAPSTVRAAITPGRACHNGPGRGPRAVGAAALSPAAVADAEPVVEEPLREAGRRTPPCASRAGSRGVRTGGPPGPPPPHRGPAPPAHRDRGGPAAGSVPWSPGQGARAGEDVAAPSPPAPPVRPPPREPVVARPPARRSGPRAPGPPMGGNAGTREGDEADSGENPRDGAQPEDAEETGRRAGRHPERSAPAMSTAGTGSRHRGCSVGRPVAVRVRARPA
ncbi:hypothetical protein SGLAU_25645 [Streptomyces glaucescens]|uniref:Uncharacterized protein n=1 Tax=Streptomyces glaucescens TaxID=1907 RepID=A0A089XGL2_STRGA|nr:hypothetical protein SGLAU_25645 [Streptomyces glaucescens]